MAIRLAIAGEEFEFPVREAATVTNTAFTAARDPILRACLKGNPGLTPGTVLADTYAIDAPLTSGWCAGNIYKESGGFAGGTTAPEVGICGASAVGGLFVGVSSDASRAQLGLFTVASDGTKTQIAAEPGTTYHENTRHRIDMQFSGFNTGSGSVAVYLNFNATPTLTYSGPLVATGITSLDRMRLVARGGGNNGVYVSQLLIADEDTRQYATVISGYPDGPGVNTWSGGTWPDLAEAVLNDTSMIASGIPGEIFKCTLTDLPSGATYSVRAIVLNMRSARGATGPSALELGFDQGGTVNTVTYPQTVVLSSYHRLMAVNPITGLPFTPAEYNNMLLCLKSAP